MEPDVVIMATSHIGSDAVVAHSFPDNKCYRGRPSQIAENTLMKLYENCRFASLLQRIAHN